MSTLQDTDIIVVGRGNTPYKCTFKDWKNSQTKAPIITGVTLADSPEAGRFTSGTFASTVALVEGVPASTKGIKAKVSGTFEVSPTSDEITNVSVTAGNPNSYQAIPAATITQSTVYGNPTASNGVTGVSAAQTDGLHYIHIKPGDTNPTVETVTAATGLSLGNVIGVTFQAGNYYCLNSDAQVFSSPEGKNWTRCGVPITGRQANLAPTIAYVDGAIYAASNDNTMGGVTVAIHKSVDNGSTWSVISQAAKPGINAVKFLLWSGKNLFVLGDYLNGVYMSTDKGVTWAKVPWSSAVPSYLATTDGNGNIAFGGSVPATLHYSSDHGATWANRDTSATTYVTGGLIVNGTLFVDGSAGYGHASLSSLKAGGVVTNAPVSDWNGSRGVIAIGDSAYFICNNRLVKVTIGHQDLTFKSDANWAQFTIGSVVSQNDRGASGTLYEKSSAAPWTMKLGTSDTFTVGKKLALPPVHLHTDLYLKLNAGLTVTDLQSADPGFTAVAGAGPYTIAFPATLPSGKAPDVDLPVGTTITTEVQATNSSGTVTQTSNTVTPA